jgi:hypothetical protein
MEDVRQNSKANARLYNSMKKEREDFSGKGSSFHLQTGSESVKLAGVF